MDKLPLNLENIKKEHDNVYDSPDYGVDLKLTEAILKKYPQNTEKEIVALKIFLINTTNSTNLRSYKKQIHINDLAEIICNIKDFDERVANGEDSVVEELAKCNDKIKLFSFASKYCCYHNNLVYGNDDYSIFDTILKKHLHLYIPKATPSLLETYRQTIDYKSYNSIITEFLKENGLAQHKDIKRMFDHFVWNQFREK